MECWEKIQLVLDARSLDTWHMLLYGPPGVGKTTLAFNLAKAREQSIYSLTCHETMEASDLWGHYGPDGNGGICWMPGVALRAWEEGALLVLDEIADIGDSARLAAYALLNDPEVAAFTLGDGRTVRPKKGFRVVGTTNETPKALPEALADRFRIKVRVGEPSPGALSTLGELGEITKNNYSTGEPMFSYREISAFKTVVDEGVLGVEVASELVWQENADAVLDHIKVAAATWYRSVATKDPHDKCDGDCAKGEMCYCECDNCEATRDSYNEEVE